VTKRKRASPQKSVRNERSRERGSPSYCDFSAERHVVEDTEGVTISEEEVARFSKAYAHMMFDQLPEHERREIREAGDEPTALAVREAVAKGLQLFPIDPSNPPGYQAVGDWFVCRLHRAQWGTYKLRYPPGDLT
jgi:hypothetical protein